MQSIRQDVLVMGIPSRPFIPHESLCWIWVFHPSLINHSLTMLIYYGRGIIAMPETVTHDHLVYCVGLIYNILISYNLYRMSPGALEGRVYRVRSHPPFSKQTPFLPNVYMYVVCR